MRHSNKKRDNVAKSRPGSNTASVKELLAMCCDYTGKSATYRTKFREPRSTALDPNPRYNEARYKEGRLINHLMNFI